MPPKKRASDEIELGPDTEKRYRRSQRVVSAICHGNRLHIIIEDLDEDERNVDCHGNSTVCKNFAFERSTGTSNTYNFKGVFLPYKRVDVHDHWINKHGGMAMSDDGRKHMSNILTPYITDQMCGYGFDKCPSFGQINLFITQFIDRFGCWRQLQLSAALARPDDLWNIIPTARFLKEFALNNNWYGKSTSHTLIKTKQTILTYPEELRALDQETLLTLAKSKGLSHLMIANTPEKKAWDLHKLRNSIANEEAMNNELLFFDLLRAEGRIPGGPVNINGFFYRRIYTMEPIEYNEDVYYEGCVARPPSVVNDWLRANGALCELEDDMPRAAAAAFERAERLRLGDDGYEMQKQLEAVAKAAATLKKDGRLPPPALPVVWETQ